MMTAERLLAGPRGRRLLLHVALTCDLDQEQSLARAVSDTSYAIAVTRGHAVSRFGWGDPGPERTMADVVAALGSLDLGPIGDAVVWEALSASVDSAMYWQEPDGDDLLAARPAVVEGLGPVAERVAALPTPLWWGGPAPVGDQWELQWDEAGAGPPRGTLAGWREEMLLEEERATVERAGSVEEMISGFWWSRPPHWLCSSTRLVDGVPVGMRLVEDALGWTRATATRLQVADGARIYEVDSAAAWAGLCREFPLEVTAQRRHDWYRTTGREGRWVVPDWAAVAGSYDAVHLSVEGYLEAATTAIPVAGELASVIAGWDPDTTWWLTDAATPTGQSRRVVWDPDAGQAG